MQWLILVGLRWDQNGVMFAKNNYLQDIGLVIKPKNSTMMIYNTVRKIV